MCGIVGYINKLDNKTEIIKKMANRISHRGPDNEGYYVDELIAIGHKRLSIIDIANGHQPMISSDENLVVSYNGEIYNYKELKKDLESDGYKFQTNSDTEVLLYGFSKWQYDLPKHLRGMFAFAIWNKFTKELFLCVDHFGVKPLYYCKFNDTFMFASEIKAFLEHPDFIKKFNNKPLNYYLTFGFNPLDETFFESVYQIPPGTCLVVKNENIQKIKYFQIDFKKEKDISKEDIKKVIASSCKKHLQSDVPLAAFLSSGVDSTYIVNLVKPKVTYTVGYENKNYSEIEYAKDMASKLGIENKSKIITKEEFFNATNKVMYYLDEPTSDASVISLYYLAKLASKDVKVILSGEGADEFFAGYNTYQELTNCYLKVPFILRKIISLILKFLPEFKGRNFLVRSGEDIEDRYLGVGNLFSLKETKKLLKSNQEINIKPVTNKIIEESFCGDDLEKMQAVDIRFWLFKDILRKGDRMSLANSLELRVPFIDYDVYNISKNLKFSQKVTNKATKVEYRNAFKDIVQGDIYKKKKLGFPVPIHDWLQDDDVIKEIKNNLEKEWVKSLFNQKELNKLISKPKKNYKKIWGIYAFIKWYDIYFNNL